MPFDVIRIAAGRLASSPLCDIVTDHILRLSANADILSADSAAAPLGISTIQMLRALITSAAGDEGRAQETKAEALLPFILAYARQHLTERNLTPARIAQAHGISSRHLYTMCSGADIRIAEWILEQRRRRANSEIRGASHEPLGLARIDGDSLVPPILRAASTLPTACHPASIETSAAALFQKLSRPN